MPGKTLPINISLQYEYPFSRKQDLHKLHFALWVSQLILNAVKCNDLFLYVELVFSSLYPGFQL